MTDLLQIAYNGTGTSPNNSTKEPIGLDLEDDKERLINVICKGNHSFPNCRLKLLQNSEFLKASLSHDPDATTIQLPIVEPDIFAKIYEFWTMCETQPFTFIRPQHMEVANIKTLMTPFYHDWASNISLKDISSMLFTTNYLRDSNLLCLCGVYIHIKLRQHDKSKLMELFGIKEPLKDLQQIKATYLPEESNEVTKLNEAKEAKEQKRKPENKARKITKRRKIKHV